MKSDVQEIQETARWLRSIAAFFGRDRKVNCLDFVRTTNVQLIPRRLLEHVPDRVVSAEEIDRIYQYGATSAQDPDTFLYLMVEPENHEVHGVLWMNVDFVTSEMGVFLLSVDSEYRSHKWLTMAARFLFSQPFDWQRIKPVINLTTTRPHIWERMGCKRSRFVRMTMTKEWFDIIDKGLD